MLKLVSFLILVISLSTDAAELVSTGVGLVRGKVITSRDVQIAQLLEAALADEPAGKEKLKILPIDSKAFGMATQATLLDTMIAMEAQSFNVVQVSVEEIDKAKQIVFKRLGKTPVWKALQVDNKELNAAILRRLQAKKFKEFRAQSSVLPITDGEALKHFEENRLKFGNLPFENFKENIKSYLSRTQVERRMKDWYDLLLNKYQVKNLIAEI